MITICYVNQIRTILCVESKTKTYVGCSVNYCEFKTLDEIPKIGTKVDVLGTKTVVEDVELNMYEHRYDVSLKTIICEDIAECHTFESYLWQHKWNKL